MSELNSAPDEGAITHQMDPKWKQKIALFIGSQFVSMLGSSLVQFAIIWHITLTTKSGSAITLITLFTFLPQIAITLFAGVWADRYDRKRMIMWSDGLIAVSTLFMAILFFMGHRSLWLIYIVAAIRSFGSGIQSPAVSALVPQIVPVDQLTRINGLFSTGYAIIMLISPAMSGILLSYWRLEHTFLIDVVTAVLAIVLLSFMKVHVHHRAAEVIESSHWEDFLEGLRYVRGHQLVLSLLLFFALFMFCIVPAAMLSPLMVARVFGEEVWRLTANEVAFSAGNIVGGICFAIWAGFTQRRYTIGSCAVGFGLFTMGLGLTGSFIVFLTMMVLMGILLPYFNATTMSMLQERVDQSYQGRVFSFINIVTSAAMPLGMMLFGPMSDIVDMKWLMIGTGGLMVLQGIVVYFSKGLKEEKSV